MTFAGRQGLEWPAMVCPGGRETEMRPSIWRGAVRRVGAGWAEVETGLEVQASNVVKYRAAIGQSNVTSSGRVRVGQARSGLCVQRPRPNAARRPQPNRISSVSRVTALYCNCNLLALLHGSRWWRVRRSCVCVRVRVPVDSTPEPATPRPMCCAPPMAERGKGREEQEKEGTRIENLSCGDGGAGPSKLRWPGS
nr:hypothetical protein CFP56_38801 [Quercus suber]